MKLLYLDEPRTLVLYGSGHSMAFRQVSRRVSGGPKASVAVELLPNLEVTKSKGFKSLLQKEIYGCLGLVSIEKQTYLAVITGASTNVANPVNYESVDRIFAVEFISLSSDEWDFITLDTNGYPVGALGSLTPGGSYDEYDSDNGPRTAHPCHELRKLLSNGSFYFSNDFDLTLTLQLRGVSLDKLRSGMDGTRRPSLEHLQTEYMWNSFMMEELVHYRSNLDPVGRSTIDDSGFLTTVIRGFARSVPVLGSLGNAGRDTMTIISKQSWKRAGTRYNARGMDDDGNVANFVETEFIYYQPSRALVYAFVEIRGSVPTFWEQDLTLINPKITLTRSLEATQPIFDKHFTSICEKYGVCHIVNLLSKTKPAEVAVLKQYHQLYSHSKFRDEMSFLEFDFHAETKALSGGFAGATKIMPMLHDSLELFGWFYFDMNEDEVVTRQDGVFRVNCLDCLDRTNLIEQVICQQVLKYITQNQSHSHGNSYRDTANLEALITRHNTLWADNGDAISQIYTGTNALKSSFTRSGKMNFAGALSDVTKSVSRMYQNTFVDSKKQSTMDLLLGYDAKSVSVKIYDPINEYVNDKLKSSESEFTSWSDITIQVGTYNVNALTPEAAASSSMDLSQWLFPVENIDRELPDIYAIGLQELIELNAGSILSADMTKPQKWAKVLEQHLNSQAEQYLLLRTEAIASMALFLFVKKTQVSKVTQVYGSSKKTGLGGMTANKGACSVRFEFGSTSIALVTSHLAAGTNAVVERYNDYLTIMLGLTFTRNYKLTDHDHILWFGDLNYRISMPNEYCRNLIEKGAFDELLEADQLVLEMSNKGAFSGFEEEQVKFYPTYKFDKGTSNYDTSEKQRVPSWTDRIVHRSTVDKGNLRQLNYHSIMDFFLSDHKPVYALFQCKVKFVDEPKRNKMAKELYVSYKQDHNGSGSLLELDDALSSSVLSSSDRFSMEILSEMNLIDDLPHLPQRPAPAPAKSPPRRVPPPPPPPLRLTANGNNFKDKPIPRKLPPPLTNQKGDVPPPAPPSRKTTLSQPAPSKPPIGFSTVPLVPGRSNSGTPNSTNGTSSTSSPAMVSPMVPSKPASLSSYKPPVQAQVPKKPSSPQSSEEATKRSTTSTPIPPKSLSEWAPLVPK